MSQANFSTNMLCRNKTLQLDTTSDVTCNNQSECFISNLLNTLAPGVLIEKDDYSYSESPTLSTQD